MNYHHVPLTSVSTEMSTRGADVQARLRANVGTPTARFGATVVRRGERFIDKVDRATASGESKCTGSFPRHSLEIAAYLREVGFDTVKVAANGDLTVGYDPVTGAPMGKPVVSGDAGDDPFSYMIADTTDNPVGNIIAELRRPSRLAKFTLAIHLVEGVAGALRDLGYVCRVTRRNEWVAGLIIGFDKVAVDQIADAPEGDSSIRETDSEVDSGASGRAPNPSWWCYNGSYVGRVVEDMTTTYDVPGTFSFELLSLSEIVRRLQRQGYSVETQERQSNNDTVHVAVSRTVDTSRKGGGLTPPTIDGTDKARLVVSEIETLMTITGELSGMPQRVSCELHTVTEVVHSLTRLGYPVDVCKDQHSKAHLTILVSPKKVKSKKGLPSADPAFRSETETPPKSIDEEVNRIVRNVETDTQISLRHMSEFTRRLANAGYTVTVNELQPDDDLNVTVTPRHESDASAAANMSMFCPPPTAEGYIEHIIDDMEAYGGSRSYVVSLDAVSKVARRLTELGYTAVHHAKQRGEASVTILVAEDGSSEGGPVVLPVGKNGSVSGRNADLKTTKKGKEKA